jgi:hypothetical protein
MGLEERIKEEMVADPESFLESHFEEAAELFRIFQDGSIGLKDGFDEAPWRERILIHLIGRRYAFEGGKADTPTLPYDYFYSKADVDDSTVRKYMNNLDDDHIVEKDEENGEWKLVAESLPKALSRIEGLKE